VTIKIVCPSVCKRLNSSRTSCPPAVSSAAGGLVGQQHRWLVRQRARDRESLPLPTDNTPGSWRALSARPRRSSMSRARVSAGLRFVPAMTAGSHDVLEDGHTFEQVEDWKTMPMWRRRMRASSSSFRPVTVSPAMTISPSSAVSRPARG